jgi:hypothetical protein
MDDIQSGFNRFEWHCKEREARRAVDRVAHVAAATVSGVSPHTRSTP